MTETGSAPLLRRAMEASSIDAILFTSSSTVKSFLELSGLKGLDDLEGRPDLISIGPQTSETIRSLGGKVAVEARRHDLTGIEEAVLECYR